MNDQRIIIGFRRGGAGSLYVGQDPAYHFNSRNELRRAIVSDVLYKAEAGRLIALRRERTSVEVILRRHEVNAAGTTSFLDEFEARRGEILDGLRTGNAEVKSQVPADDAVRLHGIRWLRQLSPPVPIAATPRVS